jgi:hypothetical protein
MSLTSPPDFPFESTLHLSIPSLSLSLSLSLSRTAPTESRGPKIVLKLSADSSRSGRHHKDKAPVLSLVNRFLRKLGRPLPTEELKD